MAKITITCKSTSSVNMEKDVEVDLSIKSISDILVTYWEGFKCSNTYLTVVDDKGFVSDLMHDCTDTGLFIENLTEEDFLKIEEGFKKRKTTVDYTIFRSMRDLVDNTIAEIKSTGVIKYDSNDSYWFWGCVFSSIGLPDHAIILPENSNVVVLDPNQLVYTLSFEYPPIPRTYLSMINGFNCFYRKFTNGLSIYDFYSDKIHIRGAHRPPDDIFTKWAGLGYLDNCLVLGNNSWVSEPIGKYFRGTTLQLIAERNYSGCSDYVMDLNCNKIAEYFVHSPKNAKEELFNKNGHPTGIEFSTWINNHNKDKWTIDLKNFSGIFPPFYEINERLKSLGIYYYEYDTPIFEKLKEYALDNTKQISNISTPEQKNLVIGYLDVMYALNRDKLSNIGGIREGYELSGMTYSQLRYCLFFKSNSSNSFYAFNPKIELLGELFKCNEAKLMEDRLIELFQDFQENKQHLIDPAAREFYFGIHAKRDSDSIDGCVLRSVHSCFVGDKKLLNEKTEYKEFTIDTEELTNFISSGMKLGISPISLLRSIIGDDVIYSTWSDTITKLIHSFNAFEGKQEQEPYYYVDLLVKDFINYLSKNNYKIKTINVK